MKRCDKSLGLKSITHFEPIVRYANMVEVIMKRSVQ